MNTKSYLNAVGAKVSSKSGGGVRPSFTGGRSHAVFNLGLDISALRPRQRYVVRALLQRMSGKLLPTPPVRQS
ncbi:MAG: hypothetical protein WCK77_01710 [Verrucomicrobiota bacterium]